MNKISNIKNLLEDKTITHIPFSFWSHYPSIDREPEKIAAKTIENYRRFDLDFIKTCNNGMYSVEDYGVKIDYSKIPQGGVAEIVYTPIQKAADWEHLPAISLSSQALARELHYLSLLIEAIGDEVPIIMTVFNPMTTAYKLSQGRILADLASEYEESVHHALRQITKITQDLAREAIRLGASGVYFANQLCDYDKMSEAEYRKWALPYDIEALKGAEEGWFNVLHLHGDHIIQPLMGEFPVDVINWHIGESKPAVKEAMVQFKQPIMGGIQRMDITHEDEMAVKKQIQSIIAEMKGKRLLLTPGCGVRLPFSAEMIDTIQHIKREYEIHVL